MEYQPIGYTRYEGYEQYFKEITHRLISTMPIDANANEVDDIRSSFFCDVSCPPIWTAIFMLDHPFVEQNGHIIILHPQVNQYLFSLPVDNANVVIPFYDSNKRLGDYLLYKTLSLFCNNSSLEDDAVTIDFGLSYKDFIKHVKQGEMEPPKKSSGQLKLLINALNVIDKPKGKVVVIGGGGPYYSTAGLTYQQLAEILPNVHFEIYDPVDVDTVCKMHDNYVVFSDFFDYNTPVVRNDVDYVIDDAYLEIPVEVKWPELKVVDKIVDGYVGKFIGVRVQDEIWLIQTPGSHTNHNYNWVLGGGEVNKSVEPYRFFGFSGTYGGYDRDRIMTISSSWLIDTPKGFTNTAQFEKLKRIFPKAAITTKALSKHKIDYKDAEILPQFFYKGGEERVYYQANPIKKGVLCAMCNYVSQVSKRLMIDPELIRNLFADIGSYSCKPSLHVKKHNMEAVIKQFSRKWVTKSFMIAELSRKFGYSEATVNSVLEAKENTGDLILYASYDGPRYAHYKYVPPTKFIMPNDMTKILTVLSYVFSCSFVGDHILANSPLIGYVGKHVRPYYDVIVPLDPSPKDLTSLEATHTFYQLTHGLRLFVRKSLFVLSSSLAPLVSLVVSFKGRVIIDQGDLIIGSHFLNSEYSYLSTELQKCLSEENVQLFIPSFRYLMSLRGAAKNTVPLLSTLPKFIRTFDDCRRSIQGKPLEVVGL